MVERQTVLSLEKGVETPFARPPLVGAKGSWCLHIESMQEWLSHLTVAHEGPAHSAPAHQQPCIWPPKWRRGWHAERRKERKKNRLVLGDVGGMGNRLDLCVCICGVFFVFCFFLYVCV